MPIFTDAERAYLTSHSLGRLATVGRAGAPHVVPVAVFYDPQTQTLVIGGGANLAASKKFRDAQRRPDVALVIDDVASLEPWTARGIEIRGRAETHMEGGEAVGQRVGAGLAIGAAWMRIRPQRIIAWGIDGDFMDHNARDVG